MMQVIFKNLDKSEMTKAGAIERLESVMDRFPDLKESHMTVTLSMENSPSQAGPDLFTVKVHCRGGRYNNVTLEKSDSNLHVALAEVVDHFLERLNRFGDRSRVKSRNNARKLLKQEIPVAEEHEENSKLPHETNKR